MFFTKNIAFIAMVTEKLLFAVPTDSNATQVHNDVSDMVWRLSYLQQGPHEQWYLCCLTANQTLTKSINMIKG